MAILPVSIALPSKVSLPTVSYNCISSFSSTSDDLFRSLSSLSLHNLPNARTAKSFTVRMGGGPRTFPGGVSKWQWKRMQKKKASQLLKAGLMRERQIYEMRKRAELKAAVSELERPWEVVEQAAPNLFSVGADEQVKVLADRFQKPGGFDLWTENDGPQLFQTPDGLPTARFLPKGVVHGIKPYGRVHSDDDIEGIEDEIDDRRMKSKGRLKGGLNSGLHSDQGSGEWLNLSGKSMKQARPDRNLSESEDSDDESPHFLNSRISGRIGSGSRPDGDRNRSRRFSEHQDRRRSGQGNIDGKGSGGRRDGDLRKFGSRIDGSSGDVHGAIRVSDSRQSAASSPREQRNNSKPQIGGYNRSRRDSKPEKWMNSSIPEEVYDMSLQKDGSYSFGSRTSN